MVNARRQHGEVVAAIEDFRRVGGQATRGVWKVHGMAVLGDIDGTSNADTALPVAQTSSPNPDHIRTFNADHISRWDPPLTGRALDLFYDIVTTHSPIIDPDGDAICASCVRRAPTHMWPCDQYRAVADVFGVKVGEVR